MPKPAYIGRFAPSPTGDLHFGSLIAAVGSYLQARSRGGAWRVRMEDIDPPREVAGSAAGIVQELERLGMHADGPVLYQSTRLQAYREAWQRLLRDHHAFKCQCSRKMLPANGIYPGTCRELGLTAADIKSIRFRAPDTPISFRDLVMGQLSQDVAKAVGDFIVRRADGLPAYQLAVVVDDAFQDITEVVRGADLLRSTPRQIALQHALKLPTPAYCHLPLAVMPDGSKLSKRLGSDPIGSARPAHAIAQALAFLGQPPPPKLAIDELWAWAIAHWDPDKIPRHEHLPLPQSMLPN
jgi:glutamyl-Q tRNA(Asp) synthetase